MKTNGSPPPVFETDDKHSYFLTTLHIHPEVSRKVVLKEKLALGREKTHQLGGETHQLEKFPDELQSKIEQLNKRSKNEEVKSLICALCVWKFLTAQEIAGFLNRKDKKHLVTQYLTPLVKEGKLKYVYPKRGNSPNQAYRAE